MTRPTYETGLDLKNEADVLGLLVATWNCTAEKLPSRYEVDYILYHKDWTAFLEIKCRSHSSTKFPTLFISVGKLVTGRVYAEAVKAHLLLVVRFTDCIMYVDLGKGAQCDLTKYEIRKGGRTDRNDPQDQEPVFHIKVADMHKLIGGASDGA